MNRLQAGWTVRCLLIMSVATGLSCRGGTNDTPPDSKQVGSRARGIHAADLSSHAGVLVTSAVSRGLAAEFRLANAELTGAEDLAFTVILTNKSDSPIRFNALFCSFPMVRLRVRMKDGTPAPLLPPPAPPVDDGNNGRIVLVPGQSTRFTYTGAALFGLPLDPGTYQIRFRNHSLSNAPGDWEGIVESPWMEFRIHGASK